MEEEEAVAASMAVAGVEVGDGGPGGVEDLVVPGHALVRGVREVAEDGEVDPRIHVAQGLDLHVLHELADLVHAGEEGREDHHGARVVGDPRGELQPGQPPRGNEQRDQALRDRGGQVAGRHEGQRGHQGQHPRRCPLAARVEDGAGHPRGGDRRDRPQIGRGGVMEHRAAVPQSK